VPQLGATVVKSVVIIIIAIIFVVVVIVASNLLVRIRWVGHVARMGGKEVHTGFW
jgi:hypothetical protein